jgi:hypothetical protein
MPLTIHLTEEPTRSRVPGSRRVPVWRLLLREAELVAPEFVTLWQTLFQDVQAHVDLHALQAAMERGAVMAATTLLQTAWEQHADIPARAILPVLLRQTVERVAIAVHPSLRAAVAVMLGAPAPPLALPASLPWIETYAGEQIEEIGATTLRAVKDILLKEFGQGTSVQRVAEQLRSEIGLTPRQVRSVGQLRQRLETDGRTAREVAKAAETASQVGLRQRALTIARTESMAAANEGSYALLQRAVQDGLATEESVRRRWLTARDEHTCKFCAPVPGMNPDGVGLDGEFQTPLGPALNPPLHPNCRCTTTTSLV